MSKNHKPEVVGQKVETPKPQEVAVQKPQVDQVPMTQEQIGVLGQDVIASDVTAPRLLLNQAISKRVMSGAQKVGTVIRSTDDSLVADRKQPFKIVPLKMENIWINSELVGKKFEFRSMEPRTAANTDAPWHYQKDGNEWERKKAITLFGILPQDITAYNAEIERAMASGDAPDLNKSLLPVVTTFQSSSFKTGARPIAEFFQKLKAMSAKFPSIGPFNYSVELSVDEKIDDKGQYFIWVAGKTEKVTDATVLEAARMWYSVLQSKSIKIDEENAPDDLNSGGESDLV